MTLVALPFGRGSVLKSYSVRSGLARLDLREVFGGLLHHGGGNARTLAARAAGHDELRMRRRAFGRVAAHAGEDLFPFLGVVQSGEDALQRVAARQSSRNDLERVRRPARSSAIRRVGELRDDVARLGKLDVGGRAAGGDIDGLRADEGVADRADRDVILAGVEPARPGS